MDGWMDGWVGGWVDGWMDRYRRFEIHALSVTLLLLHQILRSLKLLYTFSVSGHSLYNFRFELRY